MALKRAFEKLEENYLLLLLLSVLRWVGGVLLEPIGGTLSVRVHSLRKIASPLLFWPGDVSWTKSFTSARFVVRAVAISASRESRRFGKTLTIFLCSLVSYFCTIPRQSLWKSVGKEMFPGKIGGLIGRPSQRGLMLCPYRRRLVSEKLRMLSLVLIKVRTGSDCSWTILKFSVVRRIPGVFTGFSGGRGWLGSRKTGLTHHCLVQSPRTLSSYTLTYNVNKHHASKMWFLKDQS